ncbi:peptidoglycan-binding protein [Shewanella sp. 5S214]|uniref:peptidoglycan-binding domain-containing protein n=1 Tax=Shewanella sp. 5S214 TaxID=3229999 RepID=UPI00352E3B27
MSSIKITQAVGLGGVNNLNDVKVVQTALNKLLKLIPPTKSLIVDGRLGSMPENAKTVAAIKLFQSKVLNMVRPDSKIDANGRTLRKINEMLIVKSIQIAGMQDSKLFMSNVIKPALLKIGLASRKAEM